MRKIVQTVYKVMITYGYNLAELRGDKDGFKSVEQLSELK